MPNCILKLVRFWFPNPEGIDYLGHMWEQQQIKYIITKEQICYVICNKEGLDKDDIKANWIKFQHKPNSK